MHYDVKSKKLPNSEVEIEVSLPAEELEKARKTAIKELSENMELDGFRKGHVPENVVLERAGEDLLLERAADVVLRNHFQAIIMQEKFDTLGHPQVSVIKLALGNPFEFKAKFAVMPEFELPEYKAIAKKIREENEKQDKDFEATEKEVDDVLLQIRKNKAHIEWHKNNPEADHHDHPDLEKEESLPELTDELAKEAGNFKDVEELKAKIKENIIEEKKQREADKTRAKMMEAILKDTTIELPEVLVEAEINKSVAQLKDDVARMGGSWEDYLSHTKKTEDDLRKDMHNSSAERAKIQLIFNKIAIAEKIEPNQEIMEQEVKVIKEHYKDASEQSARIYVATILINQAVLKLLESQ